MCFSIYSSEGYPNHHRNWLLKDIIMETKYDLFVIINNDQLLNYSWLSSLVLHSYFLNSYCIRFTNTFQLQQLISWLHPAGLLYLKHASVYMAYPLIVKAHNLLDVL